MIQAHKTKLIEVAIPLDAINAASQHEKSPFTRRHPQSLHVWWARRPLAACRAVLFASLVDDPSARPDLYPTEEDQAKARSRLFQIIEAITPWSASKNKEVLEVAREEIRKSCGDDMPTILDPFAGGGSIPLEAHRLGLPAAGSDLNPVAVLINRALIDIPPRFRDQPPVNQAQVDVGQHSGSAGLAADILYYGEMIDRLVDDQLHGFYLPAGDSVAPLGWIWARTVRCPNPACRCELPLISSFRLSRKKGKEAWIHPNINRSQRSIAFEIQRSGDGPRDGTVGRSGATCLVCDSAAALAYIREEGAAGRMGTQLIATIIPGPKGKGKDYRTPRPSEEQIARSVPAHESLLTTAVPKQALGFRVHAYGMDEHRKLYSARQLHALKLLTDAVVDIGDQVRQDALAQGWEDGEQLHAGGTGARAYGEAIHTYLACAVSKFTDFSNALVTWNSTNENLTHLFTKHAVPMVWDFVETHPTRGIYSFSNSVRSLSGIVEDLPCAAAGAVSQTDARVASAPGSSIVIATDPPYYDNVGYADLSDFFYVWLRLMLRDVYPNEFSTMLVPKEAELIASPFRFNGGKSEAKAFFETGITAALARLQEIQDPRFPVTIYYAFKQQDAARGADTGASSGWETFLEGLLSAGFQITGTWPVRTERGARSIAIGTNALASSIVLVCRPLGAEAKLATRAEFVDALRQELPVALRRMESAGIEPVDIPQSAIGPGMAIFTRHKSVVEPNGERMSVRQALETVNQVLDEHLYEGDSELDAQSRWAVRWYEQNGYSAGEFGTADQMARAQNVSVADLAQTGILEHGRGKVRLFAASEYPHDWDPVADDNVPAWEALHQLARAWDSGGEAVTAGLISRLRSKADSVPDLARRMFALSEKRGLASDAVTFNAIVAAWPRLRQLGASNGGHENEQFGMEV